MVAANLSAQNDMVRLTVTAAEKLKQMTITENPDIAIPETSGLRLDLTAKNCFGRLQLESKPKEDDLVVESQNIRLFICSSNQNCIRKKYPNGILLFFSITGINEGIAIENPNARYPCA